MAISKRHLNLHLLDGRDPEAWTNVGGAEVISTATGYRHSPRWEAANGTIEAKTRLGRLGNNGCGQGKGTKKGQRQRNFPMHDNLHLGIVYDQKWHVDRPRRGRVSVKRGYPSRDGKTLRCA